MSISPRSILTRKSCLIWTPHGPSRGCKIKHHGCIPRVNPKAWSPQPFIMVMPTLCSRTRSYPTPKAVGKPTSSSEGDTAPDSQGSSRYKHSSKGPPGWLSWLSVRLLILAQVMILQLVRSSPVLGSALGIPSLSLSLSLSLCHSPIHAVSVSLKINKLEVCPQQTPSRPLLAGRAHKLRDPRESSSSTSFFPFKSTVSQQNVRQK